MAGKGFDRFSVLSELRYKEDELRRGHGPAGGYAFDDWGRSVRDQMSSAARFMEGQMSRVERVTDALYRSGEETRRIIVHRLAGLEVSVILDILIESCKDVALYYGGSVVVGGVAGGVAGFFAGGVGAVPGAGIGAGLGAKAGVWILGLLGLASLVEYLGESLPDAFRCYEDGFRACWGPPPGSGMRSRDHAFVGEDNAVSFAAGQFAQGHVILVMAVLMALSEYLTRGRGDKARLLQEVRESPRLGPKVADWLAANEKQLAGHPGLHLRHRAGGAGDGGAGGASPPPPPPPGRKGGREEPSGPRPMKRVDVPCFKANRLSETGIAEFDRQLAGQQAGLNDLTVKEFLEARKAFQDGLTKRDAAAAQRVRDAYEQDLIQKLGQQYRREGASPAAAEKQAIAAATEKLKTMAALHNPDFSGGGSDPPTDMGDSRINSKIGPQWRSRVGTLDQAAHAVPEADRGSVKMNAKLQRCP
ncbi:DUF6861 domain-containing protein [Eleftheria terrae]|uniref:DUF6861 domain-containing protein n=1 Tax=Eleftheria terrae TaxID=1597781 RepID=UPI00263A8AFC|nr:polymorphic toxin type 15 domain-containing protein [Eleftheria terrae]WKB52203.1 polymorphic toxin type 15 domain-containing protein [Eleftheria terrae]